MLAGQPDFEVVGEAANRLEAIDLVKKLLPDVVLMDPRMPELDGMGAIHQIRPEHPKTHVLELTTNGSDSDILLAIEAGATGILLKDTPRDELFRAIRGAAQGEAVLAPAIASDLMGRARAHGGQDQRP